MSGMAIIDTHDWATSSHSGELNPYHTRTTDCLSLVFDFHQPHCVWADCEAGEAPACNVTSGD